MKVKKIPQRMCIGCQEMKNKKDLIRIVRTPEGSTQIDPTGKKAGRGAYICPQEECLLKAIKGKRLERTFKQAIDSGVIEDLRNQLVKTS